MALDALLLNKLLGSNVTRRKKNRRRHALCQERTGSQTGIVPLRQVSNVVFSDGAVMKRLHHDVPAKEGNHCGSNSGTRREFKIEKKP